MSKIGSWLIDTNQRKAEIKHVKPYDRHSNNDRAVREYYVDYTQYRRKN